MKATFTANRIEDGSLYANTEDLWPFFSASYLGIAHAPESPETLYPGASDGDILITGRSPGARAQVYLDLDDGLSVVTLASHSGWPGSFKSGIMAPYRAKTCLSLPSNWQPPHAVPGS